MGNGSSTTVELMPGDTGCLVSWVRIPPGAGLFLLYPISGVSLIRSLMDVLLYLFSLKINTCLAMQSLPEPFYLFLPK